MKNSHKKMGNEDFHRKILTMVAQRVKPNQLDVAQQNYCSSCLVYDPKNERSSDKKSKQNLKKTYHAYPTYGSAKEVQSNVEVNFETPQKKFKLTLINTIDIMVKPKLTKLQDKRSLKHTSKVINHLYRQKTEKQEHLYKIQQNQTVLHLKKEINQLKDEIQRQANELQQSMLKKLVDDQLKNYKIEKLQQQMQNMRQAQEHHSFYESQSVNHQLDEVLLRIIQNQALKIQELNSFQFFSHQVLKEKSSISKK